jgi:hypothetical protein
VEKRDELRELEVMVRKRVDARVQMERAYKEKMQRGE